VSGAQFFPFAQLEFGGPIGLGDGRYLARSPHGAGKEVLVVQTLAARRRSRRRRRPRITEPGPPAELPLTRVTAVRATPFDDRAGADAWLDRLASDPEALDEAAREGLRLLNRALAAQRAASGDPYVHELGLERALTVRVGYGGGEQVAEGEWLEARELQDPGADRGGRREQDLRPQARVAALLGGREQADLCETLLARARIDFDAGRPREGAIQLRAAIDALLIELRNALEDPSHERDMEQLSERRTEIAGLADAALRGPLAAGGEADVGELLTLAERVLRRRRVLHG